MNATDGNEAVARLCAILNQRVIPYMLVGSYSSNVHGIPRATRDADFVVQASSKTFEQIEAELGDDFNIDPQIQFELVTGTRRRVIEYRPIDFVIELFELSEDSFDRSRFERRLSIQSTVLGQTVWYPTAEDVVIQKLRWGRPQDLADATDVIGVQFDQLDWAYIESWTDQHGTTEQLHQLRSQM